MSEDEPEDVLLDRVEIDKELEQELFQWEERFKRKFRVEVRRCPKCGQLPALCLIDREPWNVADDCEDAFDALVFPVVAFNLFCDCRNVEEEIPTPWSWLPFYLRAAILRWNRLAEGAKQ